MNIVSYPIMVDLSTSFLGISSFTSSVCLPCTNKNRKVLVSGIICIEFQFLHSLHFVPKLFLFEEIIHAHSQNVYQIQQQKQQASAHPSWLLNPTSERKIPLTGFNHFFFSLFFLSNRPT